MSSSLLSDPDFANRFRAQQPQVMQFLNEGPGSNAFVMNDGRAQRSFPRGSEISASLNEKARAGEQLRINAMTTTGTFMNKPNMGLEANKNYTMETEQNRAYFGDRVTQFLTGGSGPQLPPALKSDWVVIGLMAVIGYLLFFRK